MSVSSVTTPISRTYAWPRTEISTAETPSGVRVRLIPNKLDSRSDPPRSLLPPDLQSDLTIVSIFGFVDPRELAVQPPATAELPLELLDEIEADPVLPKLDEQ